MSGLVKTIIVVARKHLGGDMESSARLCLADAVELFDAGNFSAAYSRALRSISYSVGLFHPDYRRFAVQRIS